MKTVKFCKDCMWSKTPADDWNMDCSHPSVVATDHRALASTTQYVYTSARSEREKTWFAACGRKGKLWAKPYEST